MKTLVAILAALIFSPLIRAQQVTPAQHKQILAERKKIFSMQQKLTLLQEDVQYEMKKTQQACSAIALNNGWQYGGTMNFQLFDCEPTPAPAVKSEPPAPPKPDAKPKE